MTITTPSLVPVSDPPAVGVQEDGNEAKLVPCTAHRSELHGLCLTPHLGGDMGLGSSLKKILCLPIPRRTQGIVQELLRGARRLELVPELGGGVPGGAHCGVGAGGGACILVQGLGLLAMHQC